MSVLIHPSELLGTVFAPSSKSVVQRMLVLAALSDKPTKLYCNNLCEDILATVSALKALGVKIEIEQNELKVEPIGDNPRNSITFDCKNSGTTLRFMLPLCAALGISARLKMGESLRRRPHRELISSLISAGAEINFSDNCIVTQGGISARELYIPGNVSSQFISGLLFALAAIGGGVVNITSQCQSSPYIEMSLEALKSASVRVLHCGDRIELFGKPKLCGSFFCEGDYSSAAFWLCAAAIGKKPLAVSGLSPTSVQGDRNIIDIIKRFGAQIEIEDDTVTVLPSPLHGIELDCSDIPDLVPPLAVLAGFAEGRTYFKNASRLRLKESDRIASVTELINSLGGLAVERSDAIEIHGRALEGGVCRSHSDHRIAMAAAIASNACEGDIIIDSFFDFEKSYKNFDRDFLTLGGCYEQV